MKRIKLQQPKDIEPSVPEITPEMIQLTLKTLEARGLVFYQEGGIYVPTEKGWKLLKEVLPVKEEIVAYGHPNVVATHTTCFEITKSEGMEKDADCIIAVKANKACKDLKKEFRDALKEAKKVEITIEAEGVKDRVVAFGSPALRLTNVEDIVVRKNDFIDNRTLAILADKSANEIKQELIDKLRVFGTKLKITLEIKP